MLDRRRLFRSVGTASAFALPNAVLHAKGQLGAPVDGIVTTAELSGLRAAPLTSGPIFYDGAFYIWRRGDFSRPPLGPVDDVVIVKQDRTELTAGAWVRQFDSLSVRAFGATEGPDASAAVNGAAFRRAIAAAVSLGCPLHLVGGIYLLDADGEASGGINFARSRLRLNGDGAVLQFRGRGRAFVLDQGGPNGGFAEDMLIENLVIAGAPGVTEGFFSRGIVRSTFRNIEVRDVDGKAFHIRHGVSNHYDGLKYSGDAAAAARATHGFYIDNNGEGYYSSNCTFVNPVVENISGTGCHLEDSSGMLFVGGVFESCGTGLRISSASRDNLFVKTWMEGNRLADAILSGVGNGFVGGHFASTPSRPNVSLLADAQGSWFSGGGYIRTVHIAEGATGTSFSQIGVDENLGGNIGFQGTGNYTRAGCRKIGKSGEITGLYPDIVGPVQSMGLAGIWQPVLVADRGAVHLDAALTQGTYRRVGDLVFAQCFLSIDRVGSPLDGGLAIHGLPYPAAFRQPGVVEATRLIASSDGLQARIDRNGRALILSRLSGGAATDLSGNVGSGTTLAVSITYIAAR